MALSIRQINRWASINTQPYLDGMVLGLSRQEVMELRKDATFKAKAEDEAVKLLFGDENFDEGWELIYNWRHRPVHEELKFEEL